MNTQRMIKLCAEGRDTGADLKERIEEFTNASACGGAGISRDPAAVWREVCGDVHDLVAIVRELGDEAERLDGSRV
jgi:hypothetical protein